MALVLVRFAPKVRSLEDVGYVGPKSVSTRPMYLRDCKLAIALPASMLSVVLS